MCGPQEKAMIYTSSTTNTIVQVQVSTLLLPVLHPHPHQSLFLPQVNASSHAFQLQHTASFSFQSLRIASLILSAYTSLLTLAVITLSVTVCPDHVSRGSFSLSFFPAMKIVLQGPSDEESPGGFLVLKKPAGACEQLPGYNDTALISL